MKGLDKFLKVADIPSKKIDEKNARKPNLFLVQFTARIVNFHRTEGGLLVIKVAEGCGDEGLIYKKDNTNIEEFIKNNNLWTRKIYVDKEAEENVNVVLAEIEKEVGPDYYENEDIHNIDMIFMVKVSAFIGTDGKAYTSLWLHNIEDWGFCKI